MQRNGWQHDTPSAPVAPRTAWPPAPRQRLPRRSHGRSALLLPVLTWAASGCHAATDPALPSGAVRYAPPPVYARWWAMTEACAGISRPLASVTWYAVPGVYRVPVGSAEVDGYWSPADHRIVLVQGEYLDGGLVRHEMLHALLGVPGHPRDVFLGRCGGVVPCDNLCLRDAGPAPRPDPAAVRISPGALAFSSTLSEVADGFVTFTVRVRNPTPHPVVVVPSGGSGGPPPLPAFGYFVEGPMRSLSPSTTSDDSALAVFAPGQTKSAVFDFAIAPTLTGLGRLPGQGYNGVALGRGHYVLSGAFGGVWSDTVGLTVGP